MTAVAADPVIRNNADALKFLTHTQRIKIGALGGGGFNSTGGQIKQSWFKGYGNKTLSQLLQMIGEDFRNRAVKVQAATGILFTPEDFPDIFESRSLEDVNATMAAELAADMPLQAVRASAIKWGAHPSADETKLRTVWALHVAEIANAYGVLVDDWIAAHKANPNLDPQTMAGQQVAGQAVTGSAGGIHGFLRKAGKGFRQFFTHPLKALRRVFVTEVGKGIKRLAQNILNADDSAPWLSQYFLKPLGIHLQFTALKQIGLAMIDGDIDTFNEQAFVRSTADTFTAAGQALLVAAPFLPPPWNAAAAAVGALSVGVGGLITKVQDAAEMQRQADALARQQSEMLTAQANRQAQLQADATAKVNAGQSLQQWFQTPQGSRFYGLFVLNSQGQPVPAWVWLTDQGWVWTNVFN